MPIEGWVPGERSTYLPTAGWYMLGEVIERASGTAFESFVQSFVLEPLQMNDTYQLIDAALPEKLGSRRGVMHNTRIRPVVPDPMYAPDQLGRFVRPGSSFHGPAHDVVKLYSIPLVVVGMCRSSR